MNFNVSIHRQKRPDNYGHAKIPGTAYGKVQNSINSSYEFNWRKRLGFIEWKQSVRTERWYQMRGVRAEIIKLGFERCEFANHCRIFQMEEDREYARIGGSKPAWN